MPLAMPANSENVVATLPTSSASIANAVSRMPKRSRMSAANPLPVTAPMRVAVISTTMSSTHMMGMTHSVAKPNFAPTVEYVEMPPASLPAMAVTMPGPMAARSSHIRFGFFSAVSPLVYGQGVSLRLLRAVQDPWFCCRRCPS